MRDFNCKIMIGVECLRFIRMLNIYVAYDIRNFGTRFAKEVFKLYKTSLHEEGSWMFCAILVHLLHSLVFVNLCHSLCFLSSFYIHHIISNQFPNFGV